MKPIIKQLKPFDYLLIGITFLLSFVPAIWTYSHSQPAADEQTRTALVKINGEVVATFTLSATTPHQEVTYYPNPGQYNIVEVEGERIRVKEDNSPDQIAVQTGWISLPGELSVCLPHNLLIEIQAGQEEDEEQLILPL